jgi:uncharacterized membrane protein
VSEARSSGLKWVAAHKLAKKSGFHGGPTALMIFMKRGKQKSRKARAVHVPAAPVPVTGSLNDLELELDRLVQARVNEALETAIAALKRAM